MKTALAQHLAVNRLNWKLAALHPDVTVSLSLDTDHLEPVLYVDLISVNDEHLRGRGLGTEAMAEVLQLADQEGFLVAVEPISGQEAGVTWETGVPQGRLVDWYRRLGFVENLPPAKRKHVEVSMYRLPHS